MQRLTKLNFFDIEVLQENGQIVSMLIEFLQSMTHLEELGLENCDLAGHEIKRLAVAM